MPISYTHHDLQNRTLELQELAKKHPILIQDGETKQVLLSYDDYKKMAGETADEPFESAYDFFVKMMADFSSEELALLADDSIEFDMSFSERK